MQEKLLFRLQFFQESKMRIGFVKIYVTDLTRSLQYYTQKLGMKIDYTDEKHWAQFKSGEDVSLAIEKCDPNYSMFGSKMVGRYAGVTLMVDDIQQTYEQLTNKEVLGKPEKQSWGGTLAHLKDLDENILTLMQEAP